MSAAHGLGHPKEYVAFDDRMEASRLLFITEVLWYFSILFIKLSVACLLLRVKRDSAWRIFLLSIIAILILSVLGQTFNQFFQCRPFAIFWDPRLFHEVKCWKKSVINANIIAFSVFQVITDLIFSCIPVTFIWTLNRPRREKIVMCILMALGIFASIASILRTLELQDFYKSKDVFKLNTTIATWAIIEQQLGLLAATIPTLKAFIERALIRVGLFFYDAKTETQVRSKLVTMGFLEATFQPQRRGDGEGRSETTGSKGNEELEKSAWLKEEDAKFYM